MEYISYAMVFHVFIMHKLKKLSHRRPKEQGIS